MPATELEAARGGHATVRLRTDVFDRLCESRGARTIADKARMVGCDRRTLYRFRDGSITSPSGELMLRWARTLGVSVEALWDGPDSPPPSPPPPTPKPPAGPSPSGPKPRR